MKRLCGYSPERSYTMHTKWIVLRMSERVTGQGKRLIQTLCVLGGFQLILEIFIITINLFVMVGISDFTVRHTICENNGEIIILYSFVWSNRVNQLVCFCSIRRKKLKSKHHLRGLWLTHSFLTHDDDESMFFWRRRRRSWSNHGDSCTT